MDNSYCRTLESHISPENSMWLAENLEGVNESVDKILRLIEEEYSAVIETEDCHLQKPELIAHVSKVRHMHKLLAERYYQLTKEVRMKFSSLVEMRQSGIPNSGTEQASAFQTPDQKLSRPKSDEAGDFKLLPSSGTGSTNFSLKDGSEYSMSSSSDSDPESFYSTINKDLVSPMSVDSKLLCHKYVEPSDVWGTEVMVNGVKEQSLYGTVKAREFGNYDMLLKRIAEYEEELMITNKKLESSEKEKDRLEGEVKKNQTVVALMDSLKVQLDAAHHSIKLRDADLQVEKEKVLKVHNQVAELQSQISDYECSLELLRGKLKGSEEEIVELKYSHFTEVSEGVHKFQSQLESAHEEIALLEAKLNYEKDNVGELQDKILGYVAGMSQQDQEIIVLKAAISDIHNNFFEEKEQLESNLSGLVEQNTMLNARIEEFKMQISSLQNEVYSCKSEKMEMKASHDVQVINWQVDTENMKAEVKAKGELVEAMNRKLDVLKLKYDMLMAEKDGVNAKLDNVNAELSSKNNNIQELNNRLCQLNLEKVEMVAESERARKHADELKLKVEELQDEVNRQVAVISDRAEEKREAIRQLCFSLEHYRNGYQELRRAFTGHKHRSVLAS